MVFHARINTKLRAYICYLRRESYLSYREVARRCGISPSSAVGIRWEGFSSQLTKKRRGRPPLMTKKVKARFIRKFRKMRDENPNVRVEDVSKDCEITSISYRTFIRTLNDAGYHFLRSRKNCMLSADDRQRRMRYAKTAIKTMIHTFGQTPFFCIWTVSLLGTITSHMKMRYVLMEKSRGKAMKD